MGEGCDRSQGRVPEARGRGDRLGRRAVLLALAVGLPGLALFPGGARAPEASAQSCALCVDFVTTFDPDGPGPRVGKSRLHRNIVANVPTALDVNGDRAPLALGALPAVPDYEVKVTVQGLSAERPTIRIEKLLSAPPVLPLRIEAISGDSTNPAAEKTTFGYDTRDSTAPMLFVAEINVSDHDGNPATDRAVVDLRIGGAGESVAAVNEQFTGHPVHSRTNRTVRRIEYSDGDEPVPSMAGILVESEEGRQKLRLTTDRRSAVDFAVIQPDGSRTTGAISNIPLFTRIMTRDADADADGFDDKLVDYHSTNRVRHAEVRLFDSKSGILTEVAADALPKTADLVFGGPPGQIKLAYTASERTGRVQVDVSGGDTEFRAIAENLPTEISELTHMTNPAGGTVVYHADARADLTRVEVREENRELIAFANTVPRNIEDLTYSTLSNHLALDYVADATTPHVEVSVDDLIQGTGGDPDHRRKIVVAADDFPRELDFDLRTPDNSETTVDYVASDPVTRVKVTEDDEEPVLARAKALDLTLEMLPLSLHGAFGQDSVLVDPLGGKIGKAEFLAQRERPAAPGPDPLGDPDQAGLFLDDDPEGTDAYLLLARVHDLRRLEADTAPNLDVLLDTASSPLRSFDIDLHHPHSDFNETQRLRGSIDTLRPGTEIFVGAEDEDMNLVSYDDNGSGNGPTISLEGTNLEWLPAGGSGVAAEEFRLDFVGMPRHLAYRQATDKALPEDERNGLPLDVETSGGSLDRGDVQLTSGPDDRVLPESRNGFLLRDLADRFVIFARMRNLDSLHVDRPNADTFELDLDAPSSNVTRVDVRRDLRDEIWPGASRPGTETMDGTLASLPADVSLETRQMPGETRLAYDAAQTAESFNFTRTVGYRGPEVEVDYVNRFLDDTLPTSFEPSDFDSSQSLSLNPMPRFFRVCQVAEGNGCTQSVFTGGMFSEFSPTSANGGSIRFRADPRTHFGFHDDSAAETEFFYIRENPEPPDGCLAGEQPGPGTEDPSFVIDCEGGDVKPGRATADVELDLNELAIQSHQEDAGFVGSVIGYPDQGYIAMHTGWASDFVSCVDALTELGFENPATTCSQPGAASLHGHRAPPLDQRVTGEVEKGGALKMASESDNNWEANIFQVGALIDTVDLEFGQRFGADHRVFEGDPDELIFAKTDSGHSYCQADTTLEGNGSDFKGNFCEGDAFALP